MLLPFSSCVFVPFLFSLFLSVSPIFIWWMGLGLLRGCQYWTRSACGDWLIPWWNVGHWCLFLVTLAEGKPRYGNRHPAKIQLQILGAVSRLRGMSAGLLYFKFCWFNSSMIFVYETKKKSGNTSVDICFSFSVLGVCDDRVLDGVIYAVWDSGARGKGNEQWVYNSHEAWEAVIHVSPWVLSKYTVVREAVFLTANAYRFTSSQTRTRHAWLDLESEQTRIRCSVLGSAWVSGSVVVGFLIQTLEHFKIKAALTYLLCCCTSVLIWAAAV